MPKGIVDAFEKVDVKHHHRQTALLDAGVGHLGLQPLKEAAAVDQVRQEVLGGQVFQLAVEPRHGLDHQRRQRQVEPDEKQHKTTH
ncbi:hypothetical protein D3C71_1373710 [compost metagenome]